uniref:Transposase n=1 Tax=Globodera rostochiensis TaxID=31243 RepID=A0A914H7Y7_GLORO
MNKFLILIFVSLFASNSLDKAKSVKLELKTFDEIFGEGWWDKGAAEELKTPAPTNFGQNVHHQIDRQNTQIGQIEPNSTDQNPTLTESDHSDNAKNDKTVAKELGLSFKTIYNWKSEHGQSKPNHMYAQSEQKELMKQYYEIKDQNPKISDENIAKMFKIGTSTLFRWKRQFKRQQFHPIFVGGHSVEENAAANVQEIGHSNSGIDTESVQLEELPFQTFDELFVDEWLDKDEAEDFTTDQNPPLTESNL